MGRTSIVNLLPLSIDELKNDGRETDRDTLLFKGFMPALYKGGMDVRNYYASYFQTYVERDVMSVLKIKDRILFENFLMLLAGRVGNILNYESLSNDCGV